MSYLYRFEDCTRRGAFRIGRVECLEPKSIVTPESWSGPSRRVTVPCGRCVFCLLNRRLDWSFRIQQEMKCQEHRGWFLTLTYDDKHVPGRGVLSLRFRDVQRYLKRLRKRKLYCKYVAVGEYGGRTERPHYHMLLWTDAPVEVLSKEWYHGHVHFGQLSVKSAMYTMAYVLGLGRSYAGREKPRAQFSKGMGLGFLSKAMYDYLTEDFDEPKTMVKVDGVDRRIPRYYLAKIFLRHQMRVRGLKLKEEYELERETRYAELLARGVSDPAGYLHGLLVDRGNIVVRKLKKLKV